MSRNFGFEDVSTALSDLRSQKVIEATQIIDDYYGWWKEQNKEVINLRHLGEDINTGVIAPFIKNHSTNQKIYLTWVIWPIVTKLQRERRKHIFAKHIAPWKRGYSDSQLASYCEDWELQTVINTEKKLSILRSVLDQCHKSLTEINKLKRVYKNRGYEGNS